MYNFDSDVIGLTTALTVLSNYTFVNQSNIFSIFYLFDLLYTVIITDFYFLSIFFLYFYIYSEFSDIIVKKIIHFIAINMGFVD